MAWPPSHQYHKKLRRREYAAHPFIFTIFTMFSYRVRSAVLDAKIYHSHSATVLEDNLRITYFGAAAVLSPVRRAVYIKIDGRINSRV